MNVIPVEFYEFEMENPTRVPRYAVRMVQQVEYELPKNVPIKNINILDVFVSVLIDYIKNRFFSAIAIDVKLQPIGVVMCPPDIYNKRKSLIKLLISRLILLNAFSFIVVVYKADASAPMDDAKDIDLYNSIKEAAVLFDIKLYDYVLFTDDKMYSIPTDSALRR